MQNGEKIIHNGYKNIAKQSSIKPTNCYTATLGKIESMSVLAMNYLVIILQPNGLRITFLPRNVLIVMKHIGENLVAIG